MQCKNEIKLEENEETKESTQIIKQKGFFCMYVVAESESKKKDDADLFLSHIKTCSESITPIITEDISTSKVNREVKHNIEQAGILLPKEELATNEENVNIFKLSNVRDVQYPDDTVNKEDIKDHKPTKVQCMVQADNSPKSLKLQAAEDSDLHYDMLTPEINADQPVLMVKRAEDSATEHADSTLHSKLKLWQNHIKIMVRLQNGIPPCSWALNYFSASKELTAASFLEDVNEIISKDDGGQHCKDETNLEEPDKCNIAQNVEINQNIHDCPSEITNLSACPSADQQIFNKCENILNMCVRAKSESNKKKKPIQTCSVKMKVFRANYSVSESHIQTASELSTPEITADNSTNKVNREIKDCILLPNK